MRTRKRTRRSPEGKLSSLLQTTFGKVKQIPQSRIFWRNDVLKKNANNNDIKLQNPIDLRDIEQKINMFGYTRKEEFLNDIDQLVSNCKELGNESLIQTANTMRDMFNEELSSYTDDSDSSNTSTNKQPPQKRRKTKSSTKQNKNTDEFIDDNEYDQVKTTNSNKNSTKTENKKKSSLRTRKKSNKNSKSNKTVQSQQDKTIDSKNSQQNVNNSKNAAELEIHSHSKSNSIKKNNTDQFNSDYADYSESSSIHKLTEEIQSLRRIQETQQNTLDQLTTIVSSITQQLSNTEYYVTNIKKDRDTDRKIWSQLRQDIIEKHNNLCKLIKENGNNNNNNNNNNNDPRTESSKDESNNTMMVVENVKVSNDNNSDNDQEMQINENNNSTSEIYQPQYPLWDHYIKPPPPVAPHKDYDPKLPADQIDEIEEYSSDSDHELSSNLYNSFGLKGNDIPLWPPVTFLFRTGRIQSLSIIDIGYKYNRNKYRSQYTRQIKLSANKPPTRKNNQSTPLSNTQTNSSFNNNNNNNNNNNTKEKENNSEQKQLLLSHPFTVGYKVEVRLRGVGDVFTATIKEGKKRPVFEVCADGENTFSGNSPTIPWRTLLKSIGFKGATNGHEFYGFNIPKVRLMLNHAPPLTNGDQSLFSSFKSFVSSNINKKGISESDESKIDNISVQEKKQDGNKEENNNNNNNNKTKTKKKRKKEKEKSKETKKSRRSSKAKKNDKEPEKALLEFHSQNDTEQNSQNEYNEESDVFDIDTENEETPKKPPRTSSKKKKVNNKTRKSNLLENYSQENETQQIEDPKILSIDDSDDFVNSDDEDEDDDDDEWTPDLADEQFINEPVGNRKTKRSKYEEDNMNEEEIEEDLEALKRDAYDITGEKQQKETRTSNFEDNNGNTTSSPSKRRSTRQRRSTISNQTNLVIDQLNPDGEPVSHEPPALDAQPEYSILRRSSSDSATSNTTIDTVSTLNKEQQSHQDKQQVTFATGVTDTLNVDLACPICKRVFSQYHMPTHMSRHYQNDSSITARKKTKYKNALAEQRQRIEEAIRRMRNSPSGAKRYDTGALNRLRGSDKTTQVYGETPPKGKAKKKLEFAEPSEIQRFDNDEAVCPICGCLVKADVINDHVQSNCTRHEAKPIDQLTN